MQIQKMKENQELYVLVYLAYVIELLTMTCFGKMTKPSPLNSWRFLWRINELFKLKDYMMRNLEISSDLLKRAEMEKSIKTEVCIMCKVQKAATIYVLIIVNTLISEYIIWISKYELKLLTEKHWTNLYMDNV